uniref:Cysteine rich protein 1 n=1 Tax=Salvator merianae TaxID=96440 RepID=A0A8D0EDU3_SALMN
MLLCPDLSCSPPAWYVFSDGNREAALAEASVQRSRHERLSQERKREEGAAAGPRQLPTLLPTRQAWSLRRSESFACLLQGSAQLHEAAFKERLSPRRLPAMPKCPRCQKEVYFAEKVTSLGKDWHRPCLKCEKCQKTLTAGGHAEHDGKPYCNHPCYAALFGPKGFGRGGTESHTFK